MAVFRVEKTRDYTVMSNYHLRDKSISHGAKGVLSMMLSLPDDWDYTLKGLAAISKEGIDATRTAVLELEKAGYIVRERERKSDGKFGGTIYTIYEHPQTGAEAEQQQFKTQAKQQEQRKIKKKDGNLGKETTVLPESEKPILVKQAPESPTLDLSILVKQAPESPTLDFPTLESSTQETPTLESPTQQNTNIQNTNIQNTNACKTGINNIKGISENEEYQPSPPSPPSSPENIISSSVDVSDEKAVGTSVDLLYQQVITLYHEICVSYPKLYSLSEQRKVAITACWNKYGQSLDVFRKLFEYAESSAFMKGDNRQGWKADFDWMMSADNMAKVLEGKYNDVWKSGAKPTYPDCNAGGVRDNGTRRYMTLGEAKRQKKQFVSFPQREYDMLALERSLLGVSDLSPADCEIVKELPDDDKERASPD